MLLLKRRRGQVVQLGPECTVQVVRLQAGAVILGVTVPAAWLVERSDADCADVQSDPLWRLGYEQALRDHSACP